MVGLKIALLLVKNVCFGEKKDISEIMTLGSCKTYYLRHLCTVCIYWGFKKFHTKPVCSFFCFLVIKRILKALFSFIPYWLLNSSDLPSSGSNLRKRYTLRLLWMCILQNAAKLIQKLTPGFKSSMRNLENCSQVVESKIISNSMGYFCPKSTFLQLKHYIQRIYLTLLSITCVKIH